MKDKHNFGVLLSYSNRISLMASLNINNHYKATEAVSPFAYIKQGIHKNISMSYHYKILSTAVFSKNHLILP